MGEGGRVRERECTELFQIHSMYSLEFPVELGSYVSCDLALHFDKMSISAVKLVEKKNYIMNKKKALSLESARYVFTQKSPLFCRGKGNNSMKVSSFFHCMEPSVSF